MKIARHRLSFAVLLFALVLSLAPVHAQITPTGDAYINTSAPTTNYGNAVSLGVISPSQTTFIQFDLSSIPAGYTGSSITKATLKLYISSVTTTGSFNVDLVNGSWTEATLNANNAPALGATIAASVPVTKSQVRDYILIDITAALQDWLNGTPNDGIALVANSPFSATFESKENIKESHNAELDIVYASGNGTITGVNTDAGSGLTGGGTSGTLNLSLITTCSSGQILAWNGSAWVCQSVSGTGTVTSVGLSAPVSDFTVTGSPVTSSGTLGLNWNVVPTSSNAANAIVKRDSTGSFNANNITASGQITVSNGTSLNPISVTATAPNAAAIAAGSMGTGLTDGVLGSSFSSGQGSSGVIGIDQNSNGVSGSYTTGVTGVTTNAFGVGVLGYGTLSNNLKQNIGYSRSGLWGDDASGTGVVASSDSGSALNAFNTSTTPTLTAVNNSTGKAVFAFNSSTTDQTMYVQNNTNQPTGVIFRAEAPQVQVNGSTAFCQINTNGGLGCTGDVYQNSPANGLVKALVYVEPTRSPAIQSCFNSTLLEPAASTPPCNFQFTYHGLGLYSVDFGFYVGNRFFQGTPVYGSQDQYNVALELEHPSASAAYINTFYANTGDRTDTPFYLVVF